MRITIPKKRASSGIDSRRELYAAESRWSTCEVRYTSSLASLPRPATRRLLSQPVDGAWCRIPRVAELALADHRFLAAARRIAGRLETGPVGFLGKEVVHVGVWPQR